MHIRLQTVEGGRAWGAHLTFIRINIELTTHKNQVEELMNVRGVGRRQFAIRVLGSTGRARVFQFDNASGEWIVR